jgi:hypothetical protein
LQIPVGAGGSIGELSKETEEAEGMRLEVARKNILEQLEKMRSQLIEKEAELKAIKEGQQAAASEAG